MNTRIIDVLKRMVVMFFERYKQNIAVNGDVDPYGIENLTLASFNCGHTGYLVLTHSFYTQAQMKAYKSFNSYKFSKQALCELCVL